MGSSVETEASAGSRARASRILFIIVAIVATGYVGVALPYPILAPILLNTAPNNPFLIGDLSPELSFGLVIALYPLGMFFGNQYFGGLADDIGRKKALMITIVGSSIGYVISAAAIQAGSLPLLMASRAATGFFEGNLPIARAIAADLAPDIPKERSFGLLSGAVYFGYLLGPLLGGFFGAVWPSGPFYLAGLLFVLIFMMVAALFPSDGSRDSAPTSERTWSLLRRPRIASFFFSSLLVSLAVSLFYQCYPILLVREFGYGPVLIGWITFAMTISLLVVSVWALPVLKRLVPARATIIASVFGLALLAAGTAWTRNDVLLWLCFIGLGCCIPLVQTNLAIWASDQLGPEMQGRLMGLLGAAGAFGATIVILLGALGAAENPSAPMWAVAALAVVAGLQVLALRAPTIQPSEDPPIVGEYGRS